MFASEIIVCFKLQWIVQLKRKERGNWGKNFRDFLNGRFGGFFDVKYGKIWCSLFDWNSEKFQPKINPKFNHQFPTFHVIYNRQNDDKFSSILSTIKPAIFSLKYRDNLLLIVSLISRLSIWIFRAIWDGILRI
jgi:hypothetical protein